MLTVLLILFVVALAVAPLLQFLPSKRQRQVAQLREYAAVHGMFVEFRTTPGDDQLHRRPGAAAREVIYYGKRLPPARGAPLAAAAWRQQQDGWRSVGPRLPIPEQLQGLPGAIVAASVDQGSCGVYWLESGGEEGVEQIRRVLEAWSEALVR